MICDYEYEPVRNYISLVGAAVALACLASILLLFLIEITGRRDSPYIGIFAWVIIPAILVCSLIAVGIGVVRERRRQGVAVDGAVDPSIQQTLPAPCQSGRHLDVSVRRLSSPRMTG